MDHHQQEEAFFFVISFGRDPHPHSCRHVGWLVIIDFLFLVLCQSLSTRQSPSLEAGQSKLNNLPSVVPINYLCSTDQQHHHLRISFHSMRLIDSKAIQKECFDTTSPKGGVGASRVEFQSHNWLTHRGICWELFYLKNVLSSCYEKLQDKNYPH